MNINAFTFNTSFPVVNQEIDGKASETSDNYLTAADITSYLCKKAGQLPSFTQMISDTLEHKEYSFVLKQV